VTQTDRITPISGFPEWLPHERLAEQEILGRIRRLAELYGFVPIETRAVEPVERLTDQGETSKEIYTVQRLQGDGDGTADLGLHFDLTVPLARYVQEFRGRLRFPFKRYQIQKVWRGERPQEGRYREFYQADLDVVGDGSLSLHFDAEMPLLMHELLSALPVPRATVLVSNRKVLDGFGRALGRADTADVVRTLDKLDKIGRAGVRDALRDEVGLSDKEADRWLALAAIRGSDPSFVDEVRALGVTDELLDEGLDELATVIGAGASLPSGAVVADLHIARGLAYYTGTVYESVIEGHADLGSICSGGRYDDLASGAGGRLPGVGISVGVSRLLGRFLGGGALSMRRPAGTRRTSPRRCGHATSPRRSSTSPCASASRSATPTAAACRSCGSPASTATRAACATCARATRCRPTPTRGRRPPTTCTRGCAWPTTPGRDRPPTHARRSRPRRPLGSPTMVEPADPRLPLRDPPWVDDSFTRRVRALLRTAPLHDLEANKSLREGDWSPYDLRGLGLAAIDTVIDHMGLELGATADQVRDRLVVLARMAAPQRPAAEARRVADAVLAGLLNDRNRREAFVVGCSDWSGRAHRRATVAFKLLEEVEAPDGTVVLRATDEAVNLFVGALDRDIADAQAAAEAVLASQVTRGRLDQAVHTARAARLRSIQFANKVRRVLDTTRHDIRQVDWRRDVPDLLSEALAHLAERLEVERHLLTTIRGLIGSGDAGPAGATLLDLVEDCQVRHLELHSLLLRARTTFLDEQERQRFAVTADVRAADIGEQLLQPLLVAPATSATAAGVQFLRAVVGPVQPRPLRLVDLADSLLAPRRVGDEQADDGGPQLVDDGGDRRFTPTQWQAAGALLDPGAVEHGVRLSALLSAARTVDAETAELVALSALHAFAPEDDETPVRASDDGTDLDDPDFGGRDLLVHGLSPT
jgi:histidyl-tRNA synthetase